MRQYVLIARYAFVAKLMFLVKLNMIQTWNIVFPTIISVISCKLVVLIMHDQPNHE